MGKSAQIIGLNKQKMLQNLHLHIVLTNQCFQAQGSREA